MLLVALKSELFEVNAWLYELTALLQLIQFY